MNFEDLIQVIPFRQYTGVYLLYQNDVLVYVGVSGDIAVRLWQHRYNKKTYNRVCYIEEYNYYKCIEIENYFIDTYKPKYNRGPGKLKDALNTYGINYDPNKLKWPPSWPGGGR